MYAEEIRKVSVEYRPKIEITRKKNICIYTEFYRQQILKWNVNEERNNLWRQQEDPDGNKNFQEGADKFVTRFFHQIKISGRLARFEEMDGVEEFSVHFAL